jgi:gluconate 2-dehydrogenase gamma chain
MSEPSGRRHFLKSAAALGAAIPAGAAAQGARPKSAPDHAPGAMEHARAAASPQGRPFMFLSQAEVAFLDAAVSHLIPKDELGPGAKEAGVTYFIDQQLFGGYGSMARKYTQGPWPEGTPQQGYQSPLTPAAVYRAGIHDTNDYCRKTYGKTFDALARTQQDEVLKGLDGGKIELGQVRAQFFFNMLLANTVQGFFADPVYGGNRDKAGWKLVGFPGVAAVYTPFIEKHNVPYRARPVSIGDITGKTAQVDEHGHAVHVMLDENGHPSSS